MSIRGELAGQPSDCCADVLATGNGDIGTLFLSMASRHPGGDDADYLRWHSLDHRPEQHRLSSVRASLRAVSTPACRAARAANHAAFEAIDHVMTYFFSSPDGLAAFGQLSTALRAAGRSPFILPPVQRGVFEVREKHAAPRARLGADVLPWLPVTGIYLLVEQGSASAATLATVPGIAGLWTAQAQPGPYSTVDPGLQLTCCFLDDDPVAVAGRLQPVLAERWQQSLQGLFAAPFFTVIPYHWDRYLP